MIHAYAALFKRIFARDSDIYLLKILILAVAFATSIAVALFSFHELGYDTDHEGAGHVSRMLARNTDDTFIGNRLSASIPNAVVKSVIRHSGNVASVCRIKTLNKVTILNQLNEPFYDKNIHAADPTIKDIFSFNFAEGNIDNFTNSQGLVALASKRAASRYFAGIPAVGNTLRLTTYGDTISVTVVAVFDDFPSNTHEDFDFFISYDTSAMTALSFDADRSSVYVRQPSTAFTLPSLSGTGNDHSEYLYQPIKEIYFGPRVLSEEARHGDLQSMLILICIVSLIVLLAVCSVVNLTTITLPYRSKEIAVKKLAGITKLQLLSQFTLESFALTTMALLLGLMILLGASHYLSTMLGMDVFDLVGSMTTRFLVFIILLVLVVVISPVFMVVRFVDSSPTRLLSTDTITFPRFKRIIGIVQFGVSLFLIVSSTLVGRQIRYSLVKEPGRNHDQVVYMVCPPNIPDSAVHIIKAGWPNKNPKVIDAMAISQIPNQLKTREPGTGLFVLEADYNFKDFFQFNMVEGEWFQYTDRDSVIVVSHMASRKMHWIHETVIGVIEDFGSSFNQPEQPVKIVLAQNISHNWICFRVDEVDIRNTLRWVEDRMHKKGSSGKAYFLNKRFEHWLAYQDHLNELSRVLNIVSMLLAGCAIYGLTLSVVRYKLKEVTVHHLYGARTSHVTRLLAHGLLAQLLLAIIFFAPVTYILLNELLRSFAYSTKFSWTDPVMPVAYCLLVIIVLCTFQAFKLSRRGISMVRR